MTQRTIEAPVKGFNGLVAGVHFTDGKGSTDNEGAIAYFERQGYTVSGHVDDDAERDYPLGDPSDKWTIAQLKAYAADHDKDLGGAKSKDEIWNAIRPGGTPYKGVTTPEGVALVSDSTVKDAPVIEQADLPENVK